MDNSTHLSPLSTTSSSTSIATVSSAATSSTTTSDSDEAVLLRDWDFERFFPANANRNSVDPSMLQSSRQIAMEMKMPNTMDKLNVNTFNHKLRLEDRVKSDIFANNSQANQSFMNNLRASNAPSNGQIVNKNICIDNTARGLQQQQLLNHKRQESDSKLSLNFVRGFRRENSDFFPLSKRHSAILGSERKPVAPISQPQRSSAIFQRNKVIKGEPVLTEFVVRGREFGSDAPTNIVNSPQNKLVGQLQATSVGGTTTAAAANGSAATSSGRSFDFLRPRREKTESVILIRNTAARQQLLDNMIAQQVKHPHHAFIIYDNNCIIHHTHPSRFKIKNPRICCASPKMHVSAILHHPSHEPKNENIIYICVLNIQCRNAIFNFTKHENTKFLKTISPILLFVCF